MNMNIRRKVLCSFFIVSLFTTMFSSFLMYAKFKNILIRQVKSEVNAVMQSNKHRFDNMVKLIQKGKTI